MFSSGLMTAVGPEFSKVQQQLALKSAASASSLQLLRTGPTDPVSVEQRLAGYSPPRKVFQEQAFGSPEASQKPVP